jgi:hypothetical protein
MDMNDSTVDSTDLTADIYQIGASLLQDPIGQYGSYFPFDENKTGYRLDVSCPTFDDNISNIADVLGVDLSTAALDSNETNTSLGAVTPYEVNLTAGWNLISTPNNISTDMPTVGGDILYVFSYDNGWSIWAETGSVYNNIGYPSFSTVETGKGYWFNANSDTNISLAGGESAVCPDFSTMADGWHLVGSCQSDPQTLIDNNSNIFLIYKFEENKEWSAFGNSSSMNSMIGSIMPLTTELTATDGFWVMIK